MITALPSSVTPFASSQHGYSPGGTEKPAATVAATPQLVPMAVPPPHFLISPGGGYTLLPSVAPINGGEVLGGIASLHPLGQFAGHGRPVTAIPYYDIYHQHQQAQQQQQQDGSAHSPAQAHGVITGGDGAIPNGGTTTVRKPPESKTTTSVPPPPPPLVPVTTTPLSPGETPSPSTPKRRRSNSGGSCLSPEDSSNRFDQSSLEAEEHSVQVKKERSGGEELLQSCNRSNSDSRVDEAGTSTGGGSNSSYQISALIDVPTSLTRSSRTSSLSSSLSSFRFGGSLSTLWASQLSLSGARVPNMKSTGNLNAEAAVLPSLGNQYFGGGSLPELSVTSLTRLLPPGSTGTDSITSCPSLFTLFHSPLYVYPSQQHLATPFINANGSITFGSFLSSGSSLCNMQRSQMSEQSPPSRESPGNADITGQENRVDEGSLGTDGTSSSTPVTSLPPLASYSSVASPYGGVNVITALPAFSTLTSGIEQHTHHNTSVITPSHSVSTPHLSPTYSTAVTTTPGSDLNTLAYVATAQQRRVASEGSSSPPGSCLTTNLTSASTPPAPGVVRHSAALSPLQHSPVDSKEGILPMETQHPELWAMNGVHKMEEDQCSSNPLMSAEVRGPSGGVRKKERPYKCDHPGCGRSFSFPAHLRSHVQQIHISYRPCKCEFPSCGKRFYTPQHLNVHRRVHTGERPFVCPYAECGKAFTTAGNLKNHIRTHTGERPYACKFEGCSKRFAEMSSLKKHELTHTGEKPYKCRVCGKAFSQAGSRNTHERKHSRSDEAGGDDGKLSRRYRIKRMPAAELKEKT